MRGNIELERPLLNNASTAIRILSIEAIEKAKSGHPGMVLGMAEIGATLYGRHLKFDPANPDWLDRDRLVVSNGHGSMLLYSLLHLAGYELFDMKTIENFRQLGSPATGHPEIEFPGVEATTGPLGQGFAMGVGMALSEKILNTRFGDDLVDHHTYVMAGDGCLMEGVAQEAITLAGHWKLEKLIVLFDDNEVTIDGPTSLVISEDMTSRFMAAGWEVLEIDGHDVESIDAALKIAKTSTKPSLIRCRTVIGYGVKELQGQAVMHSGAIGADKIELMRKDLEWDHPPFFIPQEIYEYFHQAAAIGAGLAADWQQRVDTMEGDRKRQWGSQFNFKPDGLDVVFEDLLKEVTTAKPTEATRVSSHRVVNSIAGSMPSLLPGSADLTPACLPKADDAAAITGDDAGGSYIYYGIREHGMSAVMNGIAMHGGFLPVGSTFLCFTDYARPAIRLAALMRIPGIYVLSHDSITQGEDGPTHQAIEHAAIFRATPNIYFMRPADAVETVECWQAALKIPDAPVLIVCTRPEVPAVRDTATENLSERGAYVIYGEAGKRDITILATGSEVTLAIDAAVALKDEGIEGCVVSMPCWELFEMQDEDYKASVMGDAPRIAVEAFSPLGWTRYVDRESDVVGMTTFGTSAPMHVALKHFGFTVENVAALAKSKLC